MIINQSPQKSSYVQDVVVPEERGFIGAYGPLFNENNNCLDDFMQNSDILLEHEIDICTSFSDNFLFDGLINEQRSM